MLRNIHIRNVALIEEQFIEFDDGFSVLSGETGAGKSIIIESFNFVLGERASRELIKFGADKASVEAVFELAEGEPVYSVLRDLELEPEDGELILYRELSESGKNSCRVNGVPVNAGILKQIGDMLVDIHGQHAHQSLLNTKMHLTLLDSFASSETEPLLQEVSGAYRTFKKAEKALSESQMNERERAQKCDLFAYQINEIDNAKLTDGEEEELTEERNRLQHAQAIMEALGGGSEGLSGEDGVLTRLSAVSHALDSIAAFGSEYKEVSEKIRDSYYALEDAAYSVRDLRDDFSYDPASLDRIEWRLELISQLKRKYGSSVSEILAYCDGIREEYARLENIEERRESLEKEYRESRGKYLELAEKLSSARKAAGQKLADALLPEMADLGMPGASFEVHMERLSEEAYTAKGVDSVEFLLSANRGEPVKPLAHIASGGEVSRIMLAFKTVLAKSDGIPTMVFDEIDSGVSGQMGTALARKMHEIALRHQVLCITHLAQIAAYADANYLVEKREQNGRTVSKAVRLQGKERVREVARIMSGTPEDETALQHAETLIQNARMDGEKNE